MKKFEQPLVGAVNKSVQEEAGDALAEVNSSIEECEQELAQTEKELEQIEKDLAVGAIDREQADREKASLQEHYTKTKGFLDDYRRMREEFTVLRGRALDINKRQAEFFVRGQKDNKN